MRNILKKFGVFGLIFALCISFGACQEENSAAEAQAAVEDLVTALRTMDFERVGELVASESTEPMDGLVSADEDEFVREMFLNLNCEILGSEKSDSKTVFVKTKITSLDVASVMSEVMMSLFAEMAEKDFTDQELDQRTDELFEERVKAGNLPTLENEVTLTVVKDGKSWKVVTDEAFHNAISGDFITKVNQVQSGFTGSEN